MPRKKRLIGPQFAYHICSRSNNRINFGLPIEEVWSIFSDYLFFISYAYEIKIHAFILMSNHFHLQASDPNSNLSSALNYLLREVSKRINSRRGSINHVFGGRVHISSIAEPVYYYYLYKYLYQNPLKAKIVDNIEDYPWSSFWGLIGQRQLEFPLHNHANGLDCLIPEEIELQIQWLNQSITTEQNELIANGLKKREFIIPRKKKRLFT